MSRTEKEHNKICDDLSSYKIDDWHEAYNQMKLHAEKLEAELVNLVKVTENLLSEIDFEFGGWGDLSVLEEDEPDHYAIQVMNAIKEIGQ